MPIPNPSPVPNPNLDKPINPDLDSGPEPDLLVRLGMTARGRVMGEGEEGRMGWWRGLEIEEGVNFFNP